MSPIRAVQVKVLITLAFLCLPLNGQAYRITIHFMGKVDGIVSSGNVSSWDINDNFHVGDIFAGYYSYDSGTEPFVEYFSTPEGSRSKYNIDTLVFSVGDISGSARSAELTLSDNYTLKSSETTYYTTSDQYVVWADKDNDIKADYSLTLRYFSLALSDGTNKALTGSGLPGTAPLLESFSMLSFALYFGENLQTNGMYSNSLTINGTVTSVREAIPTPEPATILLFAAGGLGIIGARYTRKK